MLEIKKHKIYGRGVFSKTSIKKATIVEVSELIIIPKKKESEIIEQTKLGSYVYAYKKNGLAIALGFGSLFNHSINSNVKFFFKKDKIYFKSLRDIKKGEQLFINYGYNPTF